MGRHVGGMPLLTDLSLAMRTDPLALISGATEFVTVIYGPAVTFAFPDVKVEAYRKVGAAPEPHTLYRNFLMGQGVKGKGPQVQERIRDETMGREEAVDRKNLCNRIPIKPRTKSIRL